MCHIQNNAKSLPYSFPLTFHCQPRRPFPLLIFSAFQTTTLRDNLLNVFELTIVVCGHLTSTNNDNSHFPCPFGSRTSTSTLNTLNTYIQIQALSHRNRRRNFM